MDQRAKSAKPPRLKRILRVVSGRLKRLYHDLSTASWLYTDLITRLAIAQSFLRSGLLKVADWDKAVFLASREYPVDWISPGIAAMGGIAIEIVGPILLAIGYKTRLSALAMAALLVVSQTVYVPTTSNLYLIALLGWYALSGPGPFSLDKTLVTNNSGVPPFMRRMAILASWVGEQGSPVWMLMVRVWLALGLLAAAQVFEPNIGLATWLATTTFSEIPAEAAVMLAGALMLGLGTTIISFILSLAVGLVMVAGLHPDVSYHPILLLALYEARGPGLAALDNAIERRIEWLALFLMRPHAFR